MLTGHALFARDTVTDTLAAVVNDEPDWSRLPPDTPGAVRRLLRRCLEREQKRRLRDIGDARVELEAEEGDGRRESELTGQTAAAAGASARRRGWALIAAAGLVVAGSAIAFVWFTPRFGPPDPMHALRLSVNPPPGGEFRLENGSAISPDGRLIVYVAHTGDVDRLWLRPLGSLSARELPGTDGATSPFWSADSRSVGFFASGKLQRHRRGR